MKWIIFTGVLGLLGHGEGNSLPPSVEVDKASQAECLAGSEWESNCHYCRCSDEGIAECLKQTSCGDSIFESPKPSQLLPGGKHCAIGSTWRSRCQDCVCSSKGYAVCNMTACIGDEEPEYPYCAPNTSWRNDCNQCLCNSDGYAACTEMACISLEEISNRDLHKKDDETTIQPHSFHEKKNTKHKTPLSLDKKESLSHNVAKRSVCKPNQQFQNKCNVCQCSSDGQTFTCTQAECLERDMTKEVEVFMENEGVDHIERHSVCKPADTFFIGCNTCHCNYDGTDFSCTNKPCPLPDDVELFHELRLPILKSGNHTCKAKAMFIKDCNICWCNDEGTDFFCTRKVCVPDLTDEPPIDAPEEFRIIRKDCRPNEVFELDCNMCRCNPDGKSFSCTRRACLDLEEKIEEVPLSRKIRATPQESPKACQPGQEFRLDCNKCLCDNEGLSFSCTRIDCVALNSQQNGSTRSKREAADVASELVDVETTCTPGGVFNSECNACRCSEDGRSAKCTSAQCTPNHLDSQVREPEQDPGFRCNPGEQFKKDCNDCTCSADGRSTFCTLRFCDESLPQDLAP